MKGLKTLALMTIALFMVNLLTYGIFSVPFWLIFAVGRVLKTVLILSLAATAIELFFAAMMK